MKQMSQQKAEQLQKCLTTENGFIAAVAIDQGASLFKLIKAARQPHATTPEPSLKEFKTTLTQVISHYASAMLFDYEYGDACQAQAASQMGIMRAYELDVYASDSKERLTAMPLDMSVLRLKEKGANAIKLYLYYNPKDNRQTNDKKHVLVEKVGAECEAHQIPFLFEPLIYQGDTDLQTESFAKIKPMLVQQAMEEFSKPRYFIDLLKVEIPINIRFVAGCASNKGYSTVYSKKQAIQHYQNCAAATNLPFIYLSAGVTDKEFIESLKLAGEADIHYGGFLCGRAIWQSAISIYANDGVEALCHWAKTEGIQRYQAMVAAAQSAKLHFS